MKTLFFITPSFGRKSGGVGVSAERISGHLGSEFKLIIFSRDMTLPAYSYIADGDHFRFSGAGESKTQGQFLSDLLIHTHKDSPAHALLCFYASDLVFPTFYAAKILNLPLSLFGRGNDVDLDIFTPQGMLMIDLWQKVQRFFCVSTEMEEKIKALAPKCRTKYIPNSLDEKHFSMEHFPVRKYNRKDKIKVGLLGDIKAKKGLDILLGHLPFSRCSLEIIGHLRPETEKILHGFLCLHPEHQESIKVLSFESHTDELKKLYHNLDIVCIPSLHEGMPNVLLESMAMEKVVVASNVGGIKDVILDRKNGFLFSPWQPESFELAINEAIALFDQGIESTLQKNARTTILQSFTHKKEKKAYLKEFHSLCES